MLHIFTLLSHNIKTSCNMLYLLGHADAKTLNERGELIVAMAQHAKM